MILMRLIVGPLQVNCYILADEKTKEAVVIDPGDDAEDILRLIREKGLAVKYIVNTHAHFDHVGANRQLKEATGAELLLHEKDAVVLTSSPKQAALFSMKTTASPAADMMTLLGSIKQNLLSLPDETRVFPGHGPDTTIGDERRDNPFLNSESGFV